MANIVVRVDSAGDLPFMDAAEELSPEESSPAGVRKSEGGEASSGEGAKRPPLPAPPRTTPSRTPSRNASRDSGLEVLGETRGSRLKVSGGGSRRQSLVPPGSRRASSAASSRVSSRRASRALLDVDYDGSRRNSSRRGSRALLDVDYDGGRRLSRRGSRAVDLAEVVIAELRRPTRRSSHAISMELGEVVSIEVRRQSRASSRSSVIEEVVAKVRRQSRSDRGNRPSLLTHVGSMGGSAASATSDDEEKLKGSGVEDDEEEEDEESETGGTSVKSGPAFLDQSSRAPQFVAGIIVNLASFCNGLMFGWPSIALPLLQSRMSPIDGSAMNDEEASWLAATCMLTAFISMPAWLVVNDRYGRKITGYLVGLVFALHWIVLGVTRNVVCLYTARAFGGFGAAGIFAVCPTYSKEIAEDAIRGEIGIIVTVMFNLGILTAYSVGAVMSYKGINILGMSFVLLFILAFWQLPESPVYLLSKGKNIQAARSLQWLRGKGADILDELAALKRANRKRREEGDATFMEIITDVASRKGIIITTMLCANQSLSGIPVVFSYTVTIFMEAGDAISPNLATIIVGILLLLSSLLASYLVDRVGRRLMLMVSNAGTAVCIGSLGLYFYIKHLGIDVNSIHIGWLPITSLSLFIVFVSQGLACLPFVVMTEIFLPQAQRIASIIGYCAIWGLSFVATKFFTNIANTLGLHFCYWIFSLTCVLGGIFTYICLPETKGRSLESILDELSGEKIPLVEDDYNDEENTEQNETGKIKI